jgi:cyclase
VLFCGDLIFNGGTSRGAPIDIAAALADMVAYNGGAPLTCLA